jgi:hypothetical protein
VRGGDSLEQEEGRGCEKGPGECHPHPPSSRHILGLPSHHHLAETQPVKEFGSTDLERVGINLIEALIYGLETLVIRSVLSSSASRSVI